MLRFLLGRNGSGKTKYVRDTLADRLRAGEKGFILLVPEQFSYASERAMLARVGAKHMQELEILSFTRLAETAPENEPTSAKPEIDDGMRAVLMRLALDALGEHTRIYRRYAKRPNLLHTLVAFAKELKQCAVSVPELQIAGEHLENGALKEKVSELSLLVQMYEALVHERFGDDADKLTRLTDVILTGSYFSDKTVFVDAFAGFTKQERNVLEALMRVCRDVYITLCLPKPEDGEEINACVFDNIEREMQMLKAAAARQSVQVAKPIWFSAASDSKPAALLHLERNLYCCTKKPFLEKTDCISLCAAPNRAQESDYVARQIRVLLRDYGFRARDIAVIQRRKDTYDHMLRAAFRKYGVPYFEDRRQPVAAEPLMQFADGLLIMTVKGITTEALLRFLKTGLCGLNAEEIAALESYTVLWGIERAQWRSDFTENPSGLGVAMQDGDTARLQYLNELRQRAVAPVLHFRKAFAEGDGAAKARVLYEFLIRMGIPAALEKLAKELLEANFYELAEQQNTVWELLMQMLDALAAACGTGEITPAQFYELFRILLDSADIGQLPQGLDTVTVGTADRIRMDAPRVVFVVGANDEIFPENPPTDGILSDSDRKTLSAYGVELSDTAEYKTVDERSFVYDALTLPRERLYVSWSVSDFHGGSLRPSSLVREIRDIFPSVRVVDDALTAPIDRVQSPAAAFETLAEEFLQQDTLSETLRAYFRDDPAFAARLSALERTVSDRQAAFSDRTVSEKLFKKDMVISASRAETYYKCPFSYFCKYGLKLKPLKKAELDPAQSGTVIHYCLENVLSCYDRDTLAAMSAEQLRAAVEDTLSEYAESRLGGLEGKDARFAHMLDRLTDTVTDVLQRLVSEFAVSDFVPAAFELSIAPDGEIAPYRLPLENGGSLRIVGSVDRVDTMKKNGKTYLRVVDYKSGGKTFDLSEVLSGLNMQMLIYLYAIQENGAEKFGEIVPSGVLYLPAKSVEDKLERNADETEIENARLQNSRMNGVVLDDTDVILGMDREVSARFIPVSARGERFVGKLLDRMEFDALKDKVNDNLCSMASSLQNGRIPVLPAVQNGKNIACTYCDYACVCGYESGDDARDLKHYGKFDDVKKLLKGEEQG